MLEYSGLFDVYLDVRSQRFVHLKRTDFEIHRLHSARQLEDHFFSLGRQLLESLSGLGSTNRRNLHSHARKKSEKKLWWW